MRWRATEKSCGSEKTTERVVLSMSENLVKEVGRTPNAVAEDVTMDGLRHCGTKSRVPLARCEHFAKERHSSGGKAERPGGTKECQAAESKSS